VLPYFSSSLSPLRMCVLLYWHVDILYPAGIVRTVSATPAAITTNLISSSSVTTAVSATSNPGIQTGSIRVVQPHQLTGTTATTILAPVSISVAVVSVGATFHTCNHVSCR